MVGKDEVALTIIDGHLALIRDLQDDLCYGTGVTYLSALTLGGAYGMIEGLQRSPASAPPKLKLNSMLVCSSSFLITRAYACAELKRTASQDEGRSLETPPG